MILIIDNSGKTNNEMLKLFMETKGRFPTKTLRKSLAGHEALDRSFPFDLETGHLWYDSVDPVTKKV